MTTPVGSVMLSLRRFVLGWWFGAGYSDSEGRILRCALDGDGILFFARRGTTVSGVGLRGVLVEAAFPARSHSEPVGKRYR